MHRRRDQRSRRPTARAASISRWAASFMPARRASSPSTARIWPPTASVLSPDEKTLYVTTNGVVAFDVQPDGSLTNQRQFLYGDGRRRYDRRRCRPRLHYNQRGRRHASLRRTGKVLGTIPTPLNFITVAFSGPDKKTLYGVANNQRFDEIFTIPMIAQGFKGRAK